MKKNAALVLLAIVLTVVIGIAGSAWSEGTSVKAAGADSTLVKAAGQCGAACPHFADANKDGICDSLAFHHKDGKCSMMEQCKKDGRCTGNCPNHSAAAKTTVPAMKCDPTKCTTTGGCPMKGKTSCPGSK